MPNTIVHFEIPARDPAKLSKFYADLLDWKFEKFEGEGEEYWMVMTKEDENAPGVNGGLYRRDDTRPGYDAQLNYVGVESIDAALEKVVALGGSVKLPKMAVKGMGWSAHCADPDGNLFGLFQPDMNAA